MGQMVIYFIMAFIGIASILVSRVLRAKFEQFSKLILPQKLSGADIAQRMLHDNGVSAVSIHATGGMLTDHYNPKNRTVNLSQGVFSGYNVAAAAVAAHECGHAIQHAKGYSLLKMRSALVPAITLTSKIAPWMLIAGIALLQIFPALLYIGIAFYALSTLFSVITLPVEINASRRALAWLKSARITDTSTQPAAESALRWAAYTYVVAAIGSIATLLYYIILARSRSN